MRSVRVLLKRVDGWQQRRRRLSFLLAVILRYRADRGRQYGALLSYYGFVSLFPLLLVLVTVLGIVLEDDSDLRNRILDSVYARIPVLGAQLRVSTTSLSSSGLLLVVGLLVALWSGLAVVRNAQEALNLQWGLPRFRQPGFLSAQLRAIGALVIIGIGIVLASSATSVAAFLPDVAWVGRLFGAVIAIVLNVAVVTVLFRVLVASKVGWGDVSAGGLVGGIALWGLQLIGATYVARVIVGASDVYGAFAAVFGLLVWIALLAHVMLLASEVNVVRAKHLWPRSLTGLAPTDADRRAQEETVRRESFLPGSRVVVRDANDRRGIADGSPPRIRDG
jgi:YihY family inner membrane protein